MSEPNPRPTGMAEDLSARGAEIADKARELFQEGLVRNVVVRRHGQVVVQFPLLAGVIVAIIVPWLAAIGVVAALVTECTIEVTRAQRPPSA